jgi:hypothetical protein
MPKRSLICEFVRTNHGSPTQAHAHRLIQSFTGLGRDAYVNLDPLKEDNAVAVRHDISLWYVLETQVTNRGELAVSRKEAKLLHTWYTSAGCHLCSAR